MTKLLLLLAFAASCTPETYLDCSGKEKQIEENTDKCFSITKGSIDYGDCLYYAKRLYCKKIKVKEEDCR